MLAKDVYFNPGFSHQFADIIDQESNVVVNYKIRSAVLSILFANIDSRSYKINVRSGHRELFAKLHLDKTLAA